MVLTPGIASERVTASSMPFNRPAAAAGRSQKQQLLRKSALVVDAPAARPAAGMMFKTCIAPLAIISHGATLRKIDRAAWTIKVVVSEEEGLAFYLISVSLTGALEHPHLKTACGSCRDAPAPNWHALGRARLMYEQACLCKRCKGAWQAAWQAHDILKPSPCPSKVSDASKPALLTMHKTLGLPLVTELKDLGSSLACPHKRS